MVSEVIGWLEDILPEIKAGKAPEDSMLKFARAKNLAPALLEKLAHVYNAAKTINYLEKSSNRGGLFSVIDADALVRNYTDSLPARKAAGGFDDWLDGGTSVKAASEHAFVDAPRFPRLDAVEPAALSEAEAFSAELDKASHEIAQEWDKRAARRAELEAWLQVRADLEAEVTEKVASLVNLFRRTPELDFAQTEIDLLQLNVEGAKRACDVVAAKLSGHVLGGNVKRASGPVPKRLVNDRFGAVDQLVKLADAMGMLSSALALKSAATDEELIAMAQQGEEDDKAMQQGLDEGAIFTRIPSQTGVSPSSGGPAAAAVMPPTDGGRAPAKGPKPAIRPSEDEGGSRSAAPAKKEEGGAKTSPSLTAALVGSIPKVRAPGVSDIPGLQGLLSSRYNKGQEKIDTDVDDLRSKVVLERLMFTDPVIGDADPARVASLANSIRSQSPEVARDINAMRSVLREAIQYDSLPIASFKDLGATQKTVGEVAKGDRERRDRAYGASKPQPAAKS